MKKQENKIGNTPLLVLAIPILIEMVMAYMVPIVDVYFLSKVSDQSVAAVSAVMPFLLVGMSMIGAFQVAGVSVCSKLVGAGRPDELARAQAYFLLLMFSIGVFFSCIYFFSVENIVGALNIENQLATEASGYLQIWGGSIFLLAIYICFCTLLVVQGQMKYIIISGALMNIINVALDYVLISGNLGFAAYHAAGAAIASAIAWFVADVVIIVCAIKWGGVKFSFRPTHKRDQHPLIPIMKIGVPGLFEPLSYQAAQIVFVLFVTSLGDLSLAARAYLVSFFYITNIWNIAMANAVQTKLANSIGANLPEQAETDVRTALRFGIGGALVISICIALFGSQIMNMYTSDKNIIALVLSLLWLNVLVELGRSMNIILGGVLRASGDAVFFACVGILGMWCLGVGLGYSLSLGAGLGLMGIWIALIVDENARGFAGLARWKSGAWKRQLTSPAKAIEKPEQRSSLELEALT